MATRRDSRSTEANAAGTLNEHHRRHLLASCRYIDRLLSDIDVIVASADSQSPFARYVNDLPPTLRKLLRDYFVRLRADMLRVLERHDAMPDANRISALHAIRTALGFVDISIEELKPQYMQGYGAVPAALEPELNGLAEELKSVVATLDRALAGGEGRSFETRLARLARDGADIGVLRTLEQTIGEQGLVEFRPALEIVLGRLEEQRFEVAVFGRVSSGKSSLLNHLIGAPVLPVGVTPITAVPTRVVRGDAPGVDVTFADRGPQRTPIDRLPEFVTEAQNPGNTKHVTRLVVTVPASRLPEGVVLVDTPGLGSLATSGAAETLAYLPRCDLGIVLIDAASTLTPEDLDTIRLLLQAAIPVMVVLSKADLLGAADRQRVLAYTADQVSTQLGTAIGVHTVSTLPGHEALLDAWIRDELGPLLAQHQTLAAQSVQRKVGALRAGVAAGLRARLARRRSPDAAAPADTAPIEEALRMAAAAFDDVRHAIDALDTVPSSEADRALRQLGERVAAGLSQSPDQPAAPVVERALMVIGAERSDALARALSTLSDQVRQTLRTAARSLSLPEPATDDEWTSIMRELPRLDPGPLEIRLHLFGLNALGRRVAAARVTAALRAQAGERIVGALETHGRLLRHWGLRTLGRLRHQFDTQAQIYRVQLGGVPVGAADAGRAEAALRRLEMADPARVAEP